MVLYLNGIYVGLLILANIVAVKLFSIGDFAILPAAVIIYIFTYPIIDVIVEVYGKKEGQRTVYAGLIMQVLAVIFIMIAIHLPAAPVFTDQESFQTILNGSFRVIIASLISYAINYDQLRKKIIKLKKQGKQIKGILARPCFLLALNVPLD